MSTSLSEVNKINLINIQPTTKYVDKNGPSTNPEYYVKKVDLDKQLSNIPTNDTVVSISKNLITNALDNYYDKDHIDGQLSCKSNTDHTHTDLTLKTLNDMPIIGNTDLITTYPFIPTVGWYPFNVMQNLDFHNKVKSGYIWRLCAYNDTIFQIVNNGYVRLTIDKYGTYIDKNLRCDTINGINTSDISLNTHNHDDKYALVDHTHDDKYSKLDHNHNDKYALVDHTHDDKYALVDHTHDDKYSKLDHAHEYNDIKNNYFQEKVETENGREDDYHYVVYDASEKLKEVQEGDLKSGVVRMKIRFFENVEITATATSLTIKVGTKQFIFTESGLSNSIEKA